MAEFIRPNLLGWEEPSSSTNWCWVSRVFYGNYYISNEDCRFHAQIETDSIRWESYDHGELIDAKFACFDHHEMLIKTCYDDIANFMYANNRNAHYD